MATPSAVVVHSHPPYNRFPRFPELPSELRIDIWQQSIKPRVVQIYLLEVPTAGSQPPTFTLQVTVASPQGQPAALSVCQEAREQALERYTPLLSNDIWSAVRGLKALLRNEYDDVLILGCVDMMVDPENDTLSIGNFNAAPVITSFLPTHSFNHLVLARGARGLNSPLDYNWTYLANALPNLKKLSLRFGFQRKPLPGPPNHEEPALVTLDSNLIDMCCFTTQVCESNGREVFGIENVFLEMARYLRVKRSYWAFMFGNNNAAQNWVNLKVETSFETMKCYTPPVLVIATPERVENLDELPEDFQLQWTNETFPRYIWFGLRVADERGELLYSRLAGVEQLFREP